MNNLFEIATRRKYRFQLSGTLTVEDLWDLFPESLDKIFKDLNAQLNKEKEESLMAVKSKKDEELLNKIEIVKYIFSVKSAEKQARAEAKAIKEQKQKIMAILEEKKDKALYDMSTEQLEALLKGMGE